MSVTTGTFPGVRIVDMPDLGAVTDASSFVGEHAGSGRFAAMALRPYVTGPTSPSGQFYQNHGAVILRMNDRILLGDACANDANEPNTTMDWASEAIPGGMTTAAAQFASLNTIGGIAGMFATRASDATLTMLNSESCIALMALGINNVTSTTGALAAYFEMQHLNPNGPSFGLEIDMVNQSGVVTQINPYSQLLSPVFQANLHLGAGGARSGVVNSSAAITIVGNGAKFDKGIVFFDGTIQSSEIIATPKNTAIQWWGDASHPTFFLESSAPTAAYGITSDDTAIYIGNSPATFGDNSAAGLAVLHHGSVVNYAAFTGAATGAAPKLVATGSDTNIDMLLSPKGTGALVLGGSTSTSATPGAAGAPPGQVLRYLTVKLNNTGETVKIPCYNV